MKVLPFPQASLADIPKHLRRLADAYEASPESARHVVIVTLEPGRELEVFALGAGTHSGIALAMVMRAKEILVGVTLAESGQ
jgi:hypothetical protein